MIETPQINFRRAFSSGYGSISGECECGKKYFSLPEEVHFEEGEFEKLLKDKNAIGLDYSVGFIEFEGRVYCADCDCWNGRAEQIRNFIDGHIDAIANYINAEKKRKKLEYEMMPEIANTKD